MIKFLKLTVRNYIGFEITRKILGFKIRHCNSVDAIQRNAINMANQLNGHVNMDNTRSIPRNEIFQFIVIFTIICSLLGCACKKFPWLSPLNYRLIKVPHVRYINNIPYWYYTREIRYSGPRNLKL
uniref:Uncharacterized protein n=1 Tax=Boodleopsis pusilla TaxID=381415 RepID=A0A386AZI6_9CHLO|nr:hypothetical protein [Boodleopsis pusilla]AYC64858.1 hypothetical protein [Boodleopsis pusilla]